MQKLPKKNPTLVTLAHPSGKFQINVSERRVEHFAKQGYTVVGAPKGQSGLSGRNALVARAKELGIPAKGSNAELAAAIEEAEAE